MKNTSLVCHVGLGCAALFWSGCTFPSSEPLIPQSQVGVAATLRQGTVVSVAAVTIEGDKTNLGTMGGGAIGGAGGAGAAGGRYDTGGIIAGAVGAAAGAIVGQAVEEAATREKGQRIMLRMDNGDMIEVVQSAEDGLFREGDRVDVAVGAGNTRVSMSLGIDMGPSGEPIWYEKPGESANFYTPEKVVGR
jgi:outer membrane lipoprotein SlyB